MEGKINNINGIMIVTGSLAAISSAFWDLFVRKEAEKIFSAAAILVPNLFV